MFALEGGHKFPSLDNGFLDVNRVNQLIRIMINLNINLDNSLEVF